MQHVEAVIRDCCPLDTDHDHLADLLRRRHRVDDRIDLVVERPLLGRTARPIALRLAAARHDKCSRQHQHGEQYEREAPRFLSHHPIPFRSHRFTPKCHAAYIPYLKNIA